MESCDLLLARIAAAQHGILRVDQAMQTGLSRNVVEYQLLNGPWQRMFRGVYQHVVSRPTWKSELMAACLTGGEGTAVSHRSAAALYGLPGGSTELIEITCRRWKRSKHRALVVHETKALKPEWISSVDGMPCTTVERTLLDLGAVRGTLTVQMAFDRAIRRKLTTWDEIDQTLQSLARSGRPGVVKLRSALEARAGLPVPESEPETALLALLEHWGLPVPHPQYVVTDHSGNFIARVDAAYPNHRIALEYDSDQEHSDPAALARDNKRRNRLIEVGWRVIAARSGDTRSGGADFCRTVEAALHQVLASTNGR